MLGMDHCLQLELGKLLRLVEIVLLENRKDLEPPDPVQLQSKFDDAEAASVMLDKVTTRKNRIQSLTILNGNNNHCRVSVDN